jgi:hypothetical protein
MKTLITLISLILLLSCNKEDNSTLRNFNAIQGTWINTVDESSLAFYVYNGSLLYITTDTLKVIGDWYIDDNTLIVSYIKKNVKYKYTYIIEMLTNSNMILIHQTQHFYKRQ